MYVNLDSAGEFSGLMGVITTQATARVLVAAADFDGDANLHVLSSFYDDDKIAGYKNLVRRQHFFTGEAASSRPRSRTLNQLRRPVPRCPVGLVMY